MTNSSAQPRPAAPSPSTTPSCASIPAQTHAPLAVPSSVHPPLRIPPSPGELDALLETYDRDRRQLPAPIGGWVWGWTRSAETWNGRLAMLALLSVLLLELVTGRGAIGTLLALMPR